MQMPIKMKLQPPGVQIHTICRFASVTSITNDRGAQRFQRDAKLVGFAGDGTQDKKAGFSREWHKR
jgi:hypothetical protein